MAARAQGLILLLSLLAFAAPAGASGEGQNGAMSALSAGAVVRKKWIGESSCRASPIGRVDRSGRHGHDDPGLVVETWW